MKSSEYTKFRNHVWRGFCITHYSYLVTKLSYVAGKNCYSKFDLHINLILATVFLNIDSCIIFSPFFLHYQSSLELLFLCCRCIYIHVNRNNVINFFHLQKNGSKYSGDSTKRFKLPDNLADDLLKKIRHVKNILKKNKKPPYHNHPRIC